jgi:FlaG/FlaF family flagellin (archaellin)
MFPRRSPVSFATFLAIAVTLLLPGLFALFLKPDTTQAQTQPEALGSVRGTQGEPLANIVISLEQYRDDAAYPKVSGVSAADGTYRIQGVFPGIYRVRFSDRSGNHADRFYVDALMPDDATTITVSGNDLAGIDATLPAGIVGAISVTVISDVPSVRLESLETLLYRQADSGQWQPYRTELHSASTLPQVALAGLPAGNYRLCARLNRSDRRPQLLCHANVTPITLDAFVTEATDIAVTTSAPIPIILGFRSASPVHGIMLSPEGQALAGIRVRLAEP